MNNGKCCKTAQFPRIPQKTITLIVLVWYFFIKIFIVFLNIAGHLKRACFSWPPCALPGGPDLGSPELKGAQEGQKLLDLQGKTNSWTTARCLLSNRARRIEDTCLASHLFRSPLSCRTHRQLLGGDAERLPVARRPRKSQGESREEWKAGHWKHPSKRAPRVPVQALGDSWSVL